MSKLVTFDGLSIVEMDQECAVALPARQLLSLINVTVVNAINLSAALNVLTVGSSATAGALQQLSISQF
jgi:hypothetical protein